MTLFITLGLFSTTASATELVASGTCGVNLTWTLDNEGTLTISGTGEMYNYSSVTYDSVPWYSYRSSIVSVKIINGVTSICDYAFYECKSLASIAIPDSVTLIGEAAFMHCKSLTSIEIGSGVTSIGSWAFSCCTSLESIVIPDSVISIANAAFSWCDSLTSVKIGNSLTYIDDWMFGNCSSLTSIEIGDSVNSIGKFAFYECSSLASIVITDGVTSIGNSAFQFCSSLTNVVIPNSVTSIGDETFDYCSSLMIINYEGTIEQWRSIVKGDRWDKDTGLYTIYCTDGIIYHDETHYHYFNDWVSNNDTHWCECSCGYKDVKPHNWGNGVQTKPATEDKEGEMLYTCVDCGSTKMEIIDRLPPEKTDENKNPIKPDENENPIKPGESTNPENPSDNTNINTSAAPNRTGKVVLVGLLALVVIGAAALVMNK